MRNQPLTMPVVGPRCSRCTSLIDQTFRDIAEVIGEGRNKPVGQVDALTDTWCGRVAVARHRGKPDPKPAPVALGVVIRRRVSR